MAAVLLPDAPWSLIEPLLPPSPPRPNGARPRALGAGGSSKGHADVSEIRFHEVAAPFGPLTSRD
jgi:hypothetical protein